MELHGPKNRKRRSWFFFFPRQSFACVLKLPLLPSFLSSRQIPPFLPNAALEGVAVAVDTCDGPLASLGGTQSLSLLLLTADNDIMVRRATFLEGIYRPTIG